MEDLLSPSNVDQDLLKYKLSILSDDDLKLLVNGVCDDTHEPLFFRFCHLLNEDMMLRWLRNGFDTDLRSNYGCHVIHLACCMHYTIVVTYLLRIIGKSCFELQDNDGWFPIDHATLAYASQIRPGQYNPCFFIKFLIENGAIDHCKRSTPDLISPLIRIVLYDKRDVCGPIIKLFLENGFDANDTTIGHNLNALYFAVKNNALCNAEILLKAGTDLGCINEESVLSLAVDTDNELLVRLVLKYNAKSFSNETRS